MMSESYKTIWRSWTSMRSLNLWSDSTKNMCFLRIFRTVSLRNSIRLQRKILMLWIYCLEDRFKLSSLGRKELRMRSTGSWSFDSSRRCIIAVCCTLWCLSLDRWILGWKRPRSLRSRRLLIYQHDLMMWRALMKSRMKSRTSSKC